jgi:hypothetical protein
VDAAGGLGDGSRFAGVAGLEAALIGRPDVFAGTMAEKLLTFALGRGVGPSDGPAVRAIVRSARAADYRFADLVCAVVTSTPFRMRTSPEGQVHRRPPQAPPRGDQPSEDQPMNISKKSLPRRTFLRGVGATLALPLLDAMVPAATRWRRRRPPRSAGSGTCSCRWGATSPGGRRRARASWTSCRRSSARSSR